MKRHLASAVAALFAAVIVFVLTGTAVQAQPVRPFTDAKEMFGRFENGNFLPGAYKPHWVVKGQIARCFLMEPGKNDESNLAEVAGMAWAFYPSKEKALAGAMTFTSVTSPVELDVSAIDEDEPMLAVMMLHQDPDAPKSGKKDTLVGHIYQFVSGEVTAIVKIRFIPSGNKILPYTKIEVSTFAELGDETGRDLVQRGHALTSYQSMFQGINRVSGQRIATDGSQVTGRWHFHEEPLLRSFVTLSKPVPKPGKPKA